MDRGIVYPGSIPLDTDFLGLNRNVMVALGYLTQGVFGTGMNVVGLACTPTSPASMTVNVGPGLITSLSTIDATAYGSLPADTADPLLKTGVNSVGSTPFTLTAPTTSGQSINYLIEATFQEADAVPVVLPYANPTTPSQPYAGPNNDGAAQNTVRQQRVELQLKAGTPANTGTQTTPAVDAGWVGLYVITVDYGQTTVIAGGITTLPGAPFNGGPFAALNGSATQAFSMTTQPVGTNNNEGASTAFVQAVPHGSAVLTSSGTFTVPTGVYNLRSVKLWGGGGSGAYNTTITACGGGGSGGLGVLLNAAVTPGQVCSYTIGVGGAALSVNSTGNPGAATSITIGATTYTANGGAGGNTAGIAVDGGDALNTTLAITGGYGKAVGSGRTGDGGPAPQGGDGGSGANGQGGNGLFPGGGGAGTYNVTGGAGANGAILVEW